MEGAKLTVISGDAASSTCGIFVFIFFVFVSSLIPKVGRGPRPGQHPNARPQGKVRLKASIRQLTLNLNRDTVTIAKDIRLTDALPRSCQSLTSPFPSRPSEVLPLLWRSLS